jgi:hypothetical protein
LPAINVAAYINVYLAVMRAFSVHPLHLNNADILPCWPVRKRPSTIKLTTIYAYTPSRIIADLSVSHRDAALAPHPSADLYTHCSARDVAGFEAIRSGKEWKGLADGLISGVVLGAAWKGVSIISDKAGLTKQVSLLLPGLCMHINVCGISSSNVRLLHNRLYRISVLAVHSVGW